MRMNAILDTQSTLYIYIYISLLNNFYCYINNDFINDQEKFYLEMNWYKKHWYTEPNILFLLSLLQVIH